MMTPHREGLRIAAAVLCVGCLLSCTATPEKSRETKPARQGYGSWTDRPSSEWPAIALINQIDYVDEQHPVAGCAFLLDTGDEVLAATAKHVLRFFKSEAMTSVAFGGTLKQWRMAPKDHLEDFVVLDRLINEDPAEPLPGAGSLSDNDWLLFTIKERSPKIQPLRFRSHPLERGETVFVIGWRYTDTHRPQIVYEGRFVENDGGSILIEIDELADNTVPGLSGSPVIDSEGYLIGLMSKKAGKMQRAASIAYPRQVLERRGVQD